jgi:hypothetical protein
MGAFKLR